MKPLNDIRISFKTLGCKVNQYESGLLQGAARSGGLKEVSFEEEADICVINTCTVTAKADAESRRLVRNAQKRNPRARIIVTGCYASRASEDLRSLASAITIIPNSEKGDLVRSIRTEGENCAGTAPRGESSSWGESPPNEQFVTDRARVFLKVQDGCSGACSYCIVPKARGPSRSMEPARIVDAAGAVAEQGFSEIVLTGIHIGHYGKDLEEYNVTLEVLINKLLHKTNKIRFRISSLEATELTEGLLDLIAHEPRICRHVHLPLQSGSDRILKLMNRAYTRGAFVRVIEKIRRKNPEICIGTDVILGFPTETEADFMATYELIRERELDYVHAFTYSARQGTAAASMEDQVPKRTRQKRTSEIRALSRANRERFASFLVGRRAVGVIESEGATGKWLVLTDNYQRVDVTAKALFPRDEVFLEFIGEKQGKLLAKTRCFRDSPVEHIEK